MNDIPKLDRTLGRYQLVTSHDDKEPYPHDVSPMCPDLSVVSAVS